MGATARAAECGKRVQVQAPGTALQYPMVFILAWPSPAAHIPFGVRLRRHSAFSRGLITRLRKRQAERPRLG